MTNIKLIILALVVFGLIIAFGRNPGDEVRKKRAERAGRNLVTKIVEANKKKSGGVMGMVEGGLSGGVSPLSHQQNGNNNPMLQQLQQNQGQGNQGVNGGINPFKGANKMQPNNRTLQRPPAAGAGNGSFDSNQPPADEYYPPEPRNKQIKIPLSGMPDEPHPMAAMTPQQLALFKKKLLADRNRITDDGQSLAFWNTHVYAVDDQGNTAPMPDGRYSMYNGSWTMVVRGGQQTIADTKPY